MINYLISYLNNILITFFLIIFCIKIYYFLYIKKIINDIKKEIILLESKDNSKLIFIIDNFWNNKYIDIINYHLKEHIISINDSLQFQNILNKILSNNIKTINICIHSNGGFIQENNIMIHNLLEFNGIINTIVPYHAFSAASLLTLCGHNIYLSDTSVLGPTDPLILCNKTYVSAQSLLELNKVKKIKKIQDKIFLQIKEAEKLYNDNIKILNIIFNRKYNKNLINIFGSGNISHDCPFTKKYLISNGMNILNKIDMNNYINILNNIFKLDNFI